MRRLAVLLILALAALVYPTTSSGASAPPTHAAKLKACKKGVNSKKCRCPKGSKLVKKSHKYRCKKQQQAGGQQQGGTGGDNTGTGTGGNNTGTGTGGDNTGTGTGGDNTGTGTTTGGDNSGAPTGTGSGAQTQRDDAGYAAALAGSRFGPHNVQGSTGLFTYTYDFCTNRQFSFHSEYFNSTLNQTDEAFFNGSWTVEQGYKVLASQFGPGWAGILMMTEDNQKQARIEIDFNDVNGVVNVGSGSDFTGGTFSRSQAPC
jgi:hypothetical protein